MGPPRLVGASSGVSRGALSAWAGLLEAGRELSRELPITAEACCINAPARATAECKRALCARPPVAPSPGTWASQHRRLHTDSSVPKGSQPLPPGPSNLAAEAGACAELDDLHELAQDWRAAAALAKHHGGSSSAGGAVNPPSRSCSGDSCRSASEPGHSDGLPLTLLERTCTLLDQRHSIAARHADHAAAAGGRGGGAHAGPAAAAAAAAEGGMAGAAVPLADIITCVADLCSHARPPPPDLARSLVAAAAVATQTAPWPQAAQILNGLVRMGTVGTRYLEWTLARIQGIPPPAPRPHPQQQQRLQHPPETTSWLARSRNRLKGRSGAAWTLGQQPNQMSMGAPGQGQQQRLADTGPGVADTISLLQSLAAIHAVQGTAARNTPVAMVRLMQHLQAQLHTLPGPAPLLPLLHDITACGWRHDREPGFLKAIGDYLCSPRLPPRPVPEVAAAAVESSMRRGPMGHTAAATAAATHDDAAPSRLPYGVGGIDDDDGTVLHPPQLLALTPSQLVSVLAAYTRAGVHHDRLMERALDGVERCLQAFTPSQAARVAASCARFSHYRPSLLRRLALHVGAHVPAAVAPSDVAGIVESLARCRVREERFMGVAAAYASGHAEALLAEMEAEGVGRGRWGGGLLKPQQQQPVEVEASHPPPCQGSNQPVRSPLEGGGGRGGELAAVQMREGSEAERIWEPGAGHARHGCMTSQGDRLTQDRVGSSCHEDVNLSRAGSKSHDGSVAGAPAAAPDAACLPSLLPGEAASAQPGLCSQADGLAPHSSARVEQLPPTRSNDSGVASEELATRRLQALLPTHPPNSHGTCMGAAAAAGVQPQQPLQPSVSQAEAAQEHSSRRCSGISLEEAAAGRDDRTALFIGGLPPSLEPYRLLDELLATPGAAVDMFYMPYDYAAVGRGAPGKGCAFVGVTSPEAVAAIARRLREGPICGMKQRASLEYSPAANTHALLRTLFSLRSNHTAYVPRPGSTRSRPVLLYVSGSLRGQVQPLEPGDVLMHEWPSRLAAAVQPSLHSARQPAASQPCQGGLGSQQQQHPQQQEQQWSVHAEAALSTSQPGDGAHGCGGANSVGLATQAGLSGGHGDTQLGRVLSNSGGTGALGAAGCGERLEQQRSTQRHEDLGALPGARQQQQLPCRSQQPQQQGSCQAASQPPLQQQSHSSPDVPSPPLHSPRLGSPWPPPRAFCRTQLLDPEQLALMAHSMAALSYSHAGFLDALGCLMQRLLRPVLQDPLLAAKLLPPPAAWAAAPPAFAQHELQQQPSPALAVAAADRDLAAVVAGDWSEHVALPPPPLKSVLHALHALASQPNPSIDACRALADACTSAILAWLPPGALTEGPISAIAADNAEGEHMSVTAGSASATVVASGSPAIQHGGSPQLGTQPALELLDPCTTMRHASTSISSATSLPGGAVAPQHQQQPPHSQPAVSPVPLPLVPLPPSDVLDVHVRLLSQALTAAADHGPQLLYHSHLCNAAAALLRNHLPRLKPRAACALLQPLVRFKMPGVRQLVRAVAPLLAQQADRLSEASLVSLTWACARTELHEDRRVVTALAARTLQLLPQLPTTGAVQTFWALAVLRYQDRVEDRNRNSSRGRGGDSSGSSSISLYGSLLQLLSERYDLTARDLLLLQEGLTVHRRLSSLSSTSASSLAALLGEDGEGGEGSSQLAMPAFLEELLQRAVAGTLEAKQLQQQQLPTAAAAAAEAGYSASAAGAAGLRARGCEELFAALAPPPRGSESAGCEVRKEDGKGGGGTPTMRRRGGGQLFAACADGEDAGAGAAHAADAESGEGLAGVEGEPADDGEALAAAEVRLAVGCSGPGSQIHAAAGTPTGVAARVACRGPVVAPAPSAGSPSGPSQGRGDGCTESSLGGMEVTPAAAATTTAPSAASATAAAEAACSADGPGTTTTGGTSGKKPEGDAAAAKVMMRGLWQQIMVARQGLALEEADGVMLRLQVPEAAEARARAAFLAASARN